MRLYKKINYTYFFIFIFLTFSFKNLWAQTDFKSDSYLFTANYWRDSAAIQNVQKNKIQFQWLPILNKIQYVQDHPYNWNDGAMIPAKGWQQLARFGFNTHWKFIELQIAPEYVTAQNQKFDAFPAGADPVLWRDYYRFYNFIELPERMGENPYNKLLFGQSFLKLHYKKWAIAVSTANKWWGPAQRNALLLSNTAAGFPHISISNQEPLTTRVGKFNFEIMAGKVTNGMWEPSESYMPFRGNKLFIPKDAVWNNIQYLQKDENGKDVLVYDYYVGKNNKQRIINGINLNYQPKWIPSLTVGLEQTYMQYEKDMIYWQDHIPVKNIFTSIANDRIEKPIIQTAFYFNYEMPQAHTSFYGEVGWNLTNTSLRNWLIQPDKGYASTWGMKKIFPTSKKYYWELLAELTQVQLLTRAEQFSTGVPPSWYLGAHVREGYTNDGQLLGAGVGPGGSSQTMEFNWRKNSNRIGLTLERRGHNTDFYELAFYDSKDFRRYYVDFMTTLKVDWQFKNLTIGPRISYMQTNNYQWALFQTINDYYLPGRDIQQFMGQLNIQYKL